MKPLASLGVLLLGCQTSLKESSLVSQNQPPPSAKPSSQDGLDLKARKLVEVQGIGDVSALQVLEDGSMLVAGTCGSAVVDLEKGTVVSTAPFALPCPPYLSSRIVDMDGDGTNEFARFNTGWVGPTAVLDHNGVILWQHPSPGACESVVDVDGDRKMELLVREANSDTVELLDHEGHVRWKREMPGNEMLGFDTDGDSKQELLIIDGEQLRVFGADGNQVRSVGIPGGGYVNALQIAREGTQSGAPEVIVGTYVARGAEEGQWFHRFARDAKTHLGRERTDMRTEPAVMVPGPLYITIVNELEQADPAGFDASELLVSVTDKDGHSVGECRLSMPDKELARADGAVVALLEPTRIYVGYGDGLWEVTLR